MAPVPCSQGLSIRPTESFSSEGMAFQLTAGHPLPVAQNRLSRNSDTVAIGPGTSLPQVFQFTDLVRVSGVVRIRYQQAAAAGHDEANLWVFAQPAPGEPFRPMASVRDTVARYVQSSLDNQQEYALSLADPTKVGYVLAPPTPHTSAITPKGLTLSWPQTGRV